LQLKSISQSTAKVTDLQRAKTDHHFKLLCWQWQEHCIG